MKLELRVTPTNLRNLVRQKICEELFGERDGHPLVFGFGAALVMLPIVPASSPPIRRREHFGDDKFLWISPNALNGRGDWDNASGCAFLGSVVCGCFCQPSPNF
jgi:hypothetical protein